MLRRLRSRLSYANVLSTLAFFIAVSTGGAYAANTIGSGDVIDESLLSQDIKNNEVQSRDVRNGSLTNDDLGADAVRSGKILDGAVTEPDLGAGAVTGAKLVDGAVGTGKLADGAVTSAKVLDDAQPGGGLDQTDLAANSVGASEIQTDGVNATEVADNSIDSGEIVDFGLSNQDVGVLFAQVNADGTIANSSGGVTGTRIGSGTYAVDFGRDISNCAYSATQGEANIGGAGGAIMGATDRSGNSEAVFVTARTDAGALADRAFQLVVVC